MKGEWKNNVGGWNAKDTKRKKQTHNNRLRDNGRYIINRFDGYRDANKKVNPDVFRSDTETVLVKKGTYNSDKPIVTKADIISVYVTWNRVDDEGNFILDYEIEKTMWYSNTKYIERVWKTEGRTVNVYSDLNRGDFYYVEGTTQGLGEFLGLSSTQTRSIETGSKRNTQRTILLPDTMVERAIERKNRVIVEEHDSDLDFMYNKPIASWKRMTFFNDGKRRKFAQNRANRMDRRNIKNWIDSHDISKEVKTHHLSKSILWEIW